MSLSGFVRTAAIAVPVMLVGGGAMAQQIAAVLPGMVVLVIPGMLGMPGEPIRVVRAPDSAAPRFEQIFAEQQAMMARIVADMDALFSGGSGPMAGFQGGMNASAPGHDGVSFCQESVSVSFNGGSSRPVVNVSRSGDGCGPETGTAPVPAVTTPPSARPDLMEINAPGPVIQTPVRHPT